MTGFADLETAFQYQLLKGGSHELAMLLGLVVDWGGTGATNAGMTWYLVGSVVALTDTYYGRLLLTKVALFLGMVAIAAVNRLHFTPRLVQVGSAFAAQNALRLLRRNTVIEVVIGIVIICVVAMLGVTPHGSHHSH
jgi:putative copper export protein